MRNALSVDVEDWFQVGAFEKVIDKADWDSLAPRVERNTDAVLALFGESGVKGTFFTLGWVAHRYPALIRRIVEQGHELASHGWDHQRVFTMDAAQFRADLARSRRTLEDAGGVAVCGYRAPSFSIDKRTPWAHPVLADEGHPAVFYFHPWEIDPGQPRVANAPVKSKLRHYSRLGAMAGKLRGLIRRHDWGRMDAVVAEARAVLA